MKLQGDVFRQIEARCTQRIIINNESYFIKQHFGVGWREIIKNLFCLRYPILSASNEKQALQRLQEANIPVPKMAGYGCRGINPAKRQSFLITHELPQHSSLEDYCRNWKTSPPLFKEKKSIINKVANIARIMHQQGINHRDFYICHFLLDKKVQKLYLIDLHRAQIRKSVPKRWKIKDLAGLYFSSKDIGLTRRDLLRFIKYYRQQPLRVILTKESVFWQKVRRCGEKLYQKIIL